MSPDSRVALALAALVLLASLAAGGGLVSANGATASMAQDEADDDNETASTHEHPNDAEGEGDSERVATWLRDRLSQSLEESTVHLERGEYEKAREVLGEDYDGRLSQLAEVSGETDREEDQRTVEEFERAKENQSELVDDVEEYEETYQEYQEAREQGDQERALELARELDELAESIEENSAEVQESYETIENESDVDTSKQRDAVAEIESDIESRQEEVRETEFVATDLTITTEETTVSFADPATIEGTLTTADGEPIANEQITLKIGKQNLTTRTDASGSFSVTYRPTELPLDTTELEVRYVPETHSPYGISSSNLSVNVQQTEPTIEITETTNGTAFGEEVTIRGNVRVDTAAIESVPVIVLVDGERLGVVETDENGTFALTATLPANVAAGDVEVQAAIPFEGRAIAGTDASGSMQVAETPGELTLAAEQRDQAVHVQGELTTVDGTPIADQLVYVEIGDRTATVRTSDDGTYETLVDVPDDANAGEDLRVEAIYADQGSNIGDVSATSTIEFRTEAGMSVLGYIEQRLGISIDVPRHTSIAVPHWLSLVGFLALIGMVAYYRRSRQDRAVERAMDSEEVSSSTTDEADADRPTALLDVAQRRVREGETDLAIETAYTATRREMTDHERARAQTHWEFYDTCRANGFSGGEIDALRSLTEHFERASFSPIAASEDEAQSAVAIAERLVVDADR